MNKLIAAVAVALFALAGTSAYAADAKKKDEPAAAKAADKAASADMAKKDEAPKKAKKEKKGGC